MPTYEYQCNSCGRRVDVVHSIHATRPTTCEFCGGELRKTMSTPAIHFKGSGWAKKDARDGVPQQDKKASAGGDAGSTQASESAPAKKSGGATDTAKGSSKSASGASAAE
jgi:putative FmdB family regulatory protein